MVFLRGEKVAVYIQNIAELGNGIWDTVKQFDLDVLKTFCANGVSFNGHFLDAIVEEIASLNVDALLVPNFKSLSCGSVDDGIGFCRKLLERDMNLYLCKERMFIDQDIFPKFATMKMLFAAYDKPDFLDK